MRVAPGPQDGRLQGQASHCRFVRFIPKKRQRPADARLPAAEARLSLKQQAGGQRRVGRDPMDEAQGDSWSLLGLVLRSVG